ncbi:S1 family peptidase [Corynebacterium diphtheriae]|uniref:S1 family peptidase n=1 Tax=Corynebacterium diphtheriae TaxID=1717 RepID=UPI000B4AF390|nr:S1 family peptidase [Corynebacterium diphtheriae]OWN37808.1 protease [Corynebacterium belfantii]OWM42772.1 protease [Corynebacterium diphtheriae]OWM46069.1 protease [Corynebacterium diphtheriae]OWM97396.1 protease [Corynebacterium diphtheriae bv. mitis]OWN22168.1 protease [Corynebacterium diphtheriae bv. mitis]
MRKIVALAAASLLGIAGTSGVLGAATATALTNGTPVSPEGDTTAEGVVQVASCTGTVVASQWVLTAQHCVEVPNLQRPVYVGTTREQQHREENTFTSDYAVWAPHGDVALVHVTDALPQRLVREVRRAPVSFGDQGRVYGWGAGTGETLQYARAVVGKTSSGVRPQGNQHGAFLVQYLDEAKAGRGDSGGPLFVDGEVAGVTSFKAPQGGGRFSLFASLHGLGDWIAQTTAAPAQPSTDDAPAETASTAPRHNGPAAKPENPNSKNQQSQQPRGPLATPGRSGAGGDGTSLGLSSS